jgi:hypothetical protein
MKTLAILCVVLSLVLGLCLGASAGITRLVNYQGILTDTGGSHITGAHSLTFKIYPDSTQGATALWTEQHLGVPVSDGLFNVILGGITPIPDGLLAVGPRWMGITVDSDLEMKPREEITAAVWAFRAALADSTVALPAHSHDDRYDTKGQLGDVGTINAPGNPMDWTKLKNVPAGFADGVDDTGGGGAGGWVDDGTVVRLQTSTDKVGIGTAAPRHSLHVVNPADSANATAIYGEASSAGTTTYHDGVWGLNRGTGTTGSGVFGQANSGVGAVSGVAGASNCPSGSGVSGTATNGTGVNYGVYGKTLSPNGYAGYFEGGKSYFQNNVGIGTLTPTTKLDIAGTARVTGFAMPTGAATTYVLTSDSAGTGTWRAPLATPDGDWTVSGSNMYSAISGNVGIGTHAPASPLHVESRSTAVADRAIYGVSIPNGSYSNLYGVVGETNSSATSFPGAGVVGTSVNQSGGGWGVYGSSAGSSGVGIYGHAISATGYAGYFTGGRNYFEGNVGLGVTAPSSKLEVADNQNSMSAIYAHASGYGSAALTAEIQSSSGGVAVDGYHSGTGSGGIAVRGRVSQADQYAGYFDGGQSYFSGNVGIGTTAPTAKLDVRGDVDVSGDADVSGNLHAFGSAVIGPSDQMGIYGLIVGAPGGQGGLLATCTNPSAKALVAVNFAYGTAGYFTGDVVITGSLSKGSGSFVIDHPLDPENKLLRHNFVESPENLLIYRGRVSLNASGEGTVQLPDYFKALTKEEEATVTLTSIGKPFLTGYDWLPDHSGFTAYGVAGRDVSWVVYADRDDPVIRQLARPVEEDKGPGSRFCDRGKLLYPKAYGYPESRGAQHEQQ